MNDYCRLCFTNTSVNNDIFGRDNQLYVKMTSCLPFKVSGNDRLPHKICDECNEKLENFYEFCTMAIDVQNRLISVCGIDNETKANISLTTKVEFEPKVFQNLEALEHAESNSKSTQTEELLTIEIPIKPPHQLKEEVVDEKFPVEINEELPIPHKIEALSDDEDRTYMDIAPHSDSDDVSLFEIKKQKRKRKSKKAKIKSERKNKSMKRARKDKVEMPDPVSILETNIKQENPESVLDNSMEEIEIKKRLSECSDDENFYSIDRLGNGDIFDTGNREPYYCCICYLQSRNRFEMLAHYRAHLKNPSANPLTISGDNSGAYKCWLCGQEFPRRTNFDKHLLSDHDIKRPYKCSLCEMTFREATQILKHSQTHSYNKPNTIQPRCGVADCPNAIAAKPCPEHANLAPAAPEPVSKRFMCDTCDETFVYMRYMMEHRKRQHPEVCSKKPVHRCMHCKREFAHLNSLRRHLRMHTGERNYLCNVCGKALSSPEHLKFHIRIHNGIKPHACKTCGKAFVKKCNLKLHERVHSGERPHVCSHCGKGFSQRSTLVIHERYHSGARPYVCELCNKGFVARGLLSMHLKATCRIERI